MVADTYLAQQDRKLKEAAGRLARAGAELDRPRATVTEEVAYRQALESAAEAVFLAACAGHSRAKRLAAQAAQARYR